MHAKTNLKYFLNYIVFTNVCAIDPGVHIIINLTHQKCSNAILLGLELIYLLFNKHLLVTCSLAGTEIETGDKKMNKTSLRYVYLQIVHPVVCL